jgi:hypothetical protein
MIDKIQLILGNLNRTIEGKNQLLASLQGTEDSVSDITASFVMIYNHW